MGLRGDSLRSTAANLGTLGLGAVTGIVAAKLLGAEGRGVYAAVWSWYWVVSILTELGLAQGVAYFVSRRPSSARALLSAATPLLVISSVVATLLAGAVALLLLPDGTVAECTLIAFSGLIVSAYTNVRSAVLLGLDNQRWNIGRLVQPISYLVLVLTITAFTKTSPQIFFLSLFVSLGVSAAVTVHLTSRYMSVSSIPLDPVGPQLLPYSLKALASTVPGAVNARVDQMVLALSGDFRSLGVYALAVAVGSLVLPLALGVGYSLMPHVAAMVDTSARRQVIWRALGITAAASVSVLLAVVPLASYGVPRYFGSDFHDFGGLLLLLAPGIVALGVSRVAAEALNGLGRPGLAARGDIVGMGVTAGGLALAVPLRGAEGAALASSVGSATGLALLLYGLRVAVQEEARL